MKIAITGHSAGIGQQLAQIYTEQGHEIVGLSYRDGHNIRNVPKIVESVEHCDMFINNAQAGFAQTELLHEVWRRWRGQQKHIINISTIMALSPTTSDNYELYRIEKIALEEMMRQLYNKSPWPKMTLVRPGSVATQPGQAQPEYADVTVWANALVRILNIDPALHVFEISLGPNYG